ncbi:MAG: hypothetical protein EON90_12840 [Brevundimonas sp.]|nr:MAG: hypothetical protein EON90_12840 [Brevundimonas sp.]
MPLKMSDLFASPDHFLFAFEGEQAVFLDMDRAAYARSIFVDRRIAPASDKVLQIGVGQLAAAAPAGIGTSEIGWIFHIAHCGSTLLARALDVAGDLVIREPMALRQLGVEAANGARGAAWKTKLDLAVTLMGRRYAPEAPVIVKANVPTNIIAADLLAASPSGRAIFLHFPLEAYLLAILRSDSHRKWIETVTASLRPALAAEIGDDRDMSPATLAAALWLTQIRLYAELMDRYPSTVSLDADTLFDHPEPVLAAAFAYFGMTVEDRRVEAIVASDLFSTYSKSPGVAFDNAARLARQSAVRDAIAPELDLARAWVDRRLAARPLPERLPRPIHGEGVALMGRD